MGVSEEDMSSSTHTSCLPVHISSLKRSFLSIFSKWFTDYVGEDLGIAHDLYIAEPFVEPEAIKRVSINHPHYVTDSDAV